MVNGQRFTVDILFMLTLGCLLPRSDKEDTIYYNFLYLNTYLDQRRKPKSIFTPLVDLFYNIVLVSFKESIMRFVVVGGDAAGMSAASRAKRKDPDIDITVLEQSHDVSYSACGMPYNIADPEREIEDLVVRQARVFREKQGIDLKTGCRAESINTRE